MVFCGWFGQSLLVKVLLCKPRWKSDQHTGRIYVADYLANQDIGEAYSLGFFFVFLPFANADWLRVSLEEILDITA